MRVMQGCADKSGVLAAGRSRSLVSIVAGEKSQPTLIIQAHDGLSAKIAEQAGFEAIWVSGFAVSSSLGRRDCSEVPLAQYLKAVEVIRASSSLPLLLDGDSGYGDTNAIRVFTHQSARIGANGIVLEDNVHPKTNSFYGDHAPLVSVDEHCARIAAAMEIKEAFPDYVVVARTESLIAGRTMAEALERAAAYHKAGADAIFIHSKRADASEVLTFAEAWQHRSPLVIAPTAFPEVALSALAGSGITVVIAANQLLRAAAGAMTDVARKIRQQDSVYLEIPSMDDIFDLIGYGPRDASE